MRRVMRKLAEDRAAMLGLGLIVLLVLVAMWAWLPALSSPLAELFDLAAMAALP